jgi:acetoin utilization protein AcuB
MFVRDIMTREPVTVRPESDPLAAVAILKCGDFRRLPVVDSDGSLVGMVGDSDLEVFLSKAGSPGVMKRQHRVEQVMRGLVITVTPDCPLEEAAELMTSHKVGGLPVVEDGRLVGIVTDSDIFSQFAHVLGGGTNWLRLTVQVPNVQGQLADLTMRIAQAGGNITSVVAYDPGDPHWINVVLRVQDAPRQEILDSVAGHPRVRVLHVWERAEPAAPS